MLEMSFRGGSAKAGDRFFDTSVGRPPGFSVPESGRDKEPRFRRRSSPYVSGFNLFYSRRPESGLGFVPGIWAPKCVRIPAQKNQKNQCCVCGHFGTLVPPVASGPCPSTAQTSVCQCYGGCNVQPVPKTAGAAGLLEISGLRCAKHSSVRETMFATVPALHLC